MECPSEVVNVSDPMILFSTAVIPAQALEQVLRDMGGRCLHQARGEWVISRGDDTVWPFLQGPREPLDGAEAAAMERLLGGGAESSLVCEVRRSPGSELLALEFASRCGDRWPCVLGDCTGRFYTMEQVKQFLVSGTGIPHRRDGVIP